MGHSSLPKKIKNRGQELIARGYFSCKRLADCVYEDFCWQQVAACNNYNKSQELTAAAAAAAMTRLVRAALVASALLCAASAQRAVFGTYFPNWAHYRAAPYTFSASNLASIASRLDEINYGFLYFCPPAGTSPLPYWAVAPYGSCTDATQFQLMSVEPADASFYAAINGFKKNNSALKLLLSVGGWNFASHYFSVMSSTPANRAIFIASVKAWLLTTGADGIDIDWEVSSLTYAPLLPSDYL